MLWKTYTFTINSKQFWCCLFTHLSRLYFLNIQSIFTTTLCVCSQLHPITMPGVTASAGSEARCVFFSFSLLNSLSPTQAPLPARLPLQKAYTKPDRQPLSRLRERAGDRARAQIPRNRASKLSRSRAASFSARCWAPKTRGPARIARIRKMAVGPFGTRR